MFCLIKLPFFLIHHIILLNTFYSLLKILFKFSISEDDVDADEPWQDDGQKHFWIGCKSKSRVDYIPSKS